MDVKEITKLIQAVSEYSLTSFELEEGDFKISIKKENEMPSRTELATMITSSVAAGNANSMASMANMAGAAAAAQAANMAGVVSAANLAGVPMAMAGVPAAATEGNGGAQTEGETGISSDKVVTSPLVGTFYNAPSPDAECFVKVGDTVRKGQVLGIIEAMKLMNEIECEYDGVVEAILIGNEEVVEYGQPLFRIR